MNSDTHKTAENQKRPPKLPAIDQHVFVRCQGVRCLAFRDAEGVWRRSYSGEPLPEVLEVLSEL